MSGSTPIRRSSFVYASSIPSGDSNRFTRVNPRTESGRIAYLLLVRERESGSHWLPDNPRDRFHPSHGGVGDRRAARARAGPTRLWSRESMSDSKSRVVRELDPIRLDERTSGLVAGGCGNPGTGQQAQRVMPRRVGKTDFPRGSRAPCVARQIVRLPDDSRSQTCKEMMPNCSAASTPEVRSKLRIRRHGVVVFVRALTRWRPFAVGWASRRSALDRLPAAHADAVCAQRYALQACSIALISLCIARDPRQGLILRSLRPPAISA